MILRSFSSFLSFLIHSHSHPVTSSHLFLNFITWITVCTNEQTYWYCLTSFFKKGYMLYSFVLCPLHLKINLENYSMLVIEIFIFTAAVEHLTHLRVCTYKPMRMTNGIFDCDDSSYSNQNTVPHDLLPEFFSPSCLHESENTRVSHSVSCPCSAWRLSFSSQLSLLAQAGLGSVLWSPIETWVAGVWLSQSLSRPRCRLSHWLPLGSSLTPGPCVSLPGSPTGTVAVLWHPDLGAPAPTQLSPLQIYLLFLTSLLHSRTVSKIPGMLPNLQKKAGL